MGAQVRNEASEILSPICDQKWFDRIIPKTLKHELYI